MNAQLRDLLERIDREIVDADIFAPLPLPSVYHPHPCKCGVRLFPTDYSEQIGAEICGDCGGVMGMDCDGVSK